MRIFFPTSLHRSSLVTYATNLCRRMSSSTANSYGGADAAKLNSWLRDTRARVANGDRCALYLGNESCDMDSVASPLALAYAAHHAGDTALPVMNVKRDELHLRRDVLQELELAGVLSHNIACVDELAMEEVLARGGGLHLVDHNELTAHQSSMARYVASIVDHHADSELYLDAEPRIIERCGSSASLVSQRVKEDAALPPPLAKLLMGAILVDTHALERRAIQTDFDAAERLAKLAAIERSEWIPIMKRISAERTDMSGFDARDMLLKDYKNFQGGKLQAGIASVPMELSEWASKDDCKLTVDVMEALRLEKAVDVLLVLTTYGRQKRQIVVHGDTPVGREVRDKLGDSPGMQLEPIDVAGLLSGTTFKQRNSDATRKVTAPQVVRLLEAMSGR